MEFLIGLFIGILITYWLSRKETPASIIQANDVLPKYITYARRMSLLYRKLPNITAEMQYIINAYGQNLPAEAHSYWNETVTRYNQFFNEVSEGWEDLYDVGNEMIEMFEEMEV